MDSEKHKYWAKNNYHHSGNAVYGLGFVGAAIYYIQHSSTFIDGVIGILKAIVWPAFLIHKLFTLLGL